MSFCGSVRAAFQTALTDPQNDTICVSFQITDEILVSFTERRPAQSNEVQQIISACINERTASIVIAGVSHDACSSDGQIHLDHIRNVMDQIASSGSQALDALTGRGGWVPLIGVPEDIEAAAHGCVQIIADRNPLQAEGIRTGSHIMGTPWSRPRTILDDVTMTPTPAEAAWLPQIATGDFVHVPGETPDYDRFTLTLAPYIARAEITDTSPMDKERSLAAIATFRPEDEMEDEVFA